MLISIIDQSNLPELYFNIQLQVLDEIQPVIIQTWLIHWKNNVLFTNCSGVSTGKRHRSF